MPSFSDSIFLFILALLLFGPKKLPVLARELGKWVGEFRRASNEFKMQMEEELRVSEQEERNKQIAAMEAAAPLPALPGEATEPEHPHILLPQATADGDAAVASEDSNATRDIPGDSPADTASDVSLPSPATIPPAEPLPIASSGELRMMPPATGLPTPRERYTEEPAPERRSAEALNGFISSVPQDTNSAEHELAGVNESAPTH